RTVTARARDKPAGSYTARLLEEGVAKVAQKVGEEAVETVLAATSEDRARLASEAADLLYHLVVLLAARQLPRYRARASSSSSTRSRGSCLATSPRPRARGAGRASAVAACRSST